MVSLAVAVALFGAGCGGSERGGSGESVKIVSDLPLQGIDRVQAETMVNAIEMAVDERGGEVAGMEVEYESRDDATAQSGQWDEAKCIQNAREAARDEEIVGWIGPFNSGCAALQIPILNEAGLVMISPSNTYVGLTQEGGDPSEPEQYYPTGERNYARVIPADDKQGRLGAVLMKEEDVETVFILDDRETYGESLADQVERSAGKLGIEVVGREGIDGSAGDYRGLMSRIAETEPDAIYFGGLVENNAGQLVRDKVEAGMSNEEVLFVASDGVLADGYIRKGDDAAEGTYVTFSGIPPERLGEKGRDFVARYGERYGRELTVYSAYAYEAANVMLDAVERAAEEAGGVPDRAAVREEVFATSDYDGVLGSWGFDENGDTTLSRLAVHHVEGGEFVLDRVLDISKRNGEGL